MAFASASFLEKLRHGYRGFPSSSKAAGSSTGFLDALVELPGASRPQRCFQRTAVAVSQLKGRISEPVNAKDCIRFLACEEDERLFSALTYYNDEALRRRVATDWIEVISAIEQEVPERPGDESLSAALQADLEDWSNWCTEVGEVYIYFAFLDMKGDRGLLMQVVKHLQMLLDVPSISSLIANLQKTRRWAQATWRMMAQQENAELLGRQHVQMLQQWLLVAKENAAAELPEHGLKQSWETCFSGLQKVPWHDFVDSLQEQFLKGFCPKDLLQPLRRRLIKDGDHVTRQHWELLLDAYSDSISDILDALLEEALEQLPWAVYRVGPSDWRGISSSALSRGDAQPSSSRGARRSAKSESSRRGPLCCARAARSKVQLGLSDGAAENSHGKGVKELEEGSHTPEDPRVHLHPVEAGQKIHWDAYVDELCRAEMRWWTVDDSDRMEEDQLRLAALRAVNSELVITRKALLLRVASGEMAKNRPIVEFGGEPQQLPAVLVSPNEITMSPTVTKFGRGSKRKMMLPDMFMNEPIASRSHFSISFDLKSERYQVADAGSKWGTFLKVQPAGTKLSCGDWIRIGNAEMVVRFCGSTCKSKRHFRGGPSLQMRFMNSFSGLGSLNQLSLVPDEEEPEDLPVQGLLSRTRAWSSSAVDKMCHHPGLQSEKTRINPLAHTGPAPLPWAPLELDFVSGPCMGQRISVTEKVCTIGRADSCTIQISDPMLANVSRTHCMIRNDGHSTKIMDNNSTNGTWKRLSCVLEPSQPQELRDGACLLAGVHEFRVEEAEMSRDWIPSVAGRTLQLAART